MSVIKSIFLIYLFFLLVGMKIILKDGNFIEVDSFHRGESRSQMTIHRQKINIPNILIDFKATMKLVEIEKKGISIFMDYSTIIFDKKSNYNELVNLQNHKKTENNIVPRFKLETRKETSSFFMELPDSKMKDEDFLEKIKKKGIMFKLNVPVKSR